MDTDEAKWERMRDVLVAEGLGRAPRIASTRTLFGIPSAVDQAIEVIVAEDEARRKAARASSCESGGPAGRTGIAAQAVQHEIDRCNGTLV